MAAAWRLSRSVVRLAGCAAAYASCNTVVAIIAMTTHEPGVGTATVEADGKAWTCVLAPLSRMTSRGLPAGSIAVGDTVTVVGYPSREETAEMRAERITVNEKTVELR